MKRAALILVGALTTALAGCAQTHETSIVVEDQPGLSGTTGQILAEGSSAADRALDLYAIRYAGATPGTRLLYTPSGTGAGQNKFIEGGTDMAVSDTALNPEQAVAAAARCRGNEAWHLPMAMTSMSIAFRLDGVPTLTLNSDIIARIYKAEILTWNDPAIAALNPGVPLPNVPVTPVYRIDPSGTTETLQRYLQATTNGAWKTISQDYAGFGGFGADGSTGVVGTIAATNGTIGYVETGYARDAKLGIAQINFGAGPVEPSAEAVAAATNNTTFAGRGHNLILDTSKLYDIARNQPGTYPLIMPGYTIVCSAGYNPETHDRIKDFLTTATRNQGQELRELGYIPLGEPAKERVTAAVEALS